MVSDITRDKLTFEAFKKRYLDVLSGNHDFEEDLISFRLMQEDGQMTNAGVLFADHVESLGMKFGLWFEPEMVNEDSDLYRAHPDWAFTDPGRKPVMARDQLE